MCSSDLSWYRNQRQFADHAELLLQVKIHDDGRLRTCQGVDHEEQPELNSISSHSISKFSVLSSALFSMILTAILRHLRQSSLLDLQVCIFQASVIWCANVSAESETMRQLFRVGLSADVGKLPKLPYPSYQPKDPYLFIVFISPSRCPVYTLWEAKQFCNYTTNIT